MIEGNGGDAVVQNMRLDDVVKEVVADETKVTIDSRCGAARKSPRFGLILGKRRIAVMQIGDGDYRHLVSESTSRSVVSTQPRKTDQASD